MLEGFLAIAGAQRVFAEVVLAASAVGIVDAVAAEEAPGEVLAGDRRLVRFAWYVSVRWFKGLGFSSLRKPLLRKHLRRSPGVCPSRWDKYWNKPQWPGANSRTARVVGSLAIVEFVLLVRVIVAIRSPGLHLCRDERKRYFVSAPGWSSPAGPRAVDETHLHVAVVLAHLSKAAWPWSPGHA